MQGSTKTGGKSFRPAMREELALSDRQEKCPACGYTIEDGEHRCEKCGRRLSVSRRGSAPELLSWPAASNREGPQPAQAGAVPEVVPRPPEKPPRRPAFPEPLRRQLSERVEEFRTRRLHPTLPLRLPLGHNEEPGAVHAVIPMRPLPNPSEQSREVPAGGGRPRRSRSSPVLQAALEFPSPSPRAEPLPLPLPTVAPFRLRALGHSMDFACMMAALLVFLVPLKLAAGTVVLNRFLLLGGLGGFLLLAVLYGVIFLYLAGATPAMKRLGIRMVDFDGMPASRPQRLWRLLGTIVSAGSFLLGFFWAVVDEERFSWHDRISKTFLTTTKR